MNSAERAVLDDALRGARAAGLDVTFTQGSPGEDDGRLTVAWAGGHHTFPVEIKRTLRPSLVHLLDSPREAVLITEYASDGVAEALTARGLNLLDAAGNIRLAAPGLHVQVSGRRRRPSRLLQSRPNIAQDPFTPAGLKVSLVVLLAAGRRATVRDVASCAQVSVGTGQRILTLLTERGYLGPDRELTRPRDLLDHWTGAWLASRSDGERFSSGRGWPGGVNQGELPDGVLPGGEWAASLDGLPIRPSTATVYVTAHSAPQAIRAGRLKSDPQGRVELREIFWDLACVQRWSDAAAAAPPQADRVPSVLVRADLLALNDPRATEVARQMEQEDADLRRLFESA